jgi:hypothetical protein
VASSHTRSSRSGARARRLRGSRRRSATRHHPADAPAA